MGDPENKDKQSCLDLFLVSRNLFKYVTALDIDKYKYHTPYYVNISNKKSYTDHFACILTFKGIPMKKKNVK